MIAYPASLIAVGGARTGIAPANLLEIQDVNGNVYLWSDRKIAAPSLMLAAPPEAVGAHVSYPIALPAGHQVTWALPGKAAYTRSGSSSATGSTAAGFLSINGGIAAASVTWNNFIMPPLPAGAVIYKAYLVLQCAGFSDGSVANVAVTSNAWTGPLSGAFGAEYSSQIMGTITPGSIISASITASINDAVSEGTYQDLTITFVGIAIEYSSSVLTTGLWQYAPWLLSVPSFTFNRSLQTDTGAFVVQNISGDSLSRDFERLARISALEGALFVYRLWQPDAEAAWIEIHGTLTVKPVGVDTAQLQGAQLLNPSQDDTPLEIYCETCQVQWGGRRCGSTETTECLYSFETCQVIERPMMVLNDFEKNYGEAAANTAFNIINRRRTI